VNPSHAPSQTKKAGIGSHDPYLVRSGNIPLRTTSDEESFVFLHDFVQVVRQVLRPSDSNSGNPRYLLRPRGYAGA